MRFHLRPSGAQHLAQVNLRTITLDLSHVPGTLHDPTYTQVNWGPIVRNGELTEYGEIVRQDGSKQRFWDQNLLTPYLVAFENATKEAARAQAEFDA